MTTFLFSPTYSYLPAYNQLQYGLQSTNSSRGGFSYLTGVKIDNSLISTLSTQQLPNLTYSTVDIHRIAQTEISYDITFDVIGATSTPESIKSLKVEVGETYNNSIRFNSISVSSGKAVLNLTATPILSINDRVEVLLDDTTYNQYLNNFWKVTNIVGNSITIDADYTNPGVTQSGYIREGREYYDASFNNGSVDITTTNVHKLSAGDTFLLQLDTYAYGLINIATASSPSGITNLQTNVNGVTYSLIGSTVTGSSTASLAAALATEINSYSTDFTAFNNPSDRPFVVYIYSERLTGDLSVGSSFTYSTSGTVNLTATPFSKTPKQGPIGGWNSFNGVWKVRSVLSSTKIATDIPWQFSTITGSQRGSIISLSNYVDSVTAELETKWIMNRTFQYEDFFEYVNPPLALTEDPRTCISFSDWNDFGVVDIMTLIGPTGSAVTSFTMRVTYPVGGAFFDYVYPLQIVKGNKEPRVSFGVGPANLNPLSTTFSTTKPESYNITIYDDFGNIFYNKNFCYKCRTKTYYRLKWLNPLGGWDFYDFNYADRTISGEKETFYRAIGSVKGNTWVKSNGERGLTVYDNRTFDNYLFYTDLLKRDEAEWLSGLFNSPEVYLLEGSLLKPIIITGEEFIRFGEANKVRQLQFEARLAYNNITQVN